VELRVSDCNQNIWSVSRPVTKFYELQTALVNFHKKDPNRKALIAKSKINGIFGLWQRVIKTSPEAQGKRVAEFKEKHGSSFVKFVNYWIGVKTAKQSALLWEFLNDENDDPTEAASEVTIRTNMVSRNPVKNIIQGITSTKAQNLENFMNSFVANCKIFYEPGEQIIIGSTNCETNCGSSQRSPDMSPHGTVERLYRRKPTAQIADFECDSFTEFDSDEEPDFYPEIFDENFDNKINEFTDNLVDFPKLQEDVFVKKSQRHVSKLTIYTGITLSISNLIMVVISSLNIESVGSIGQLNFEIFKDRVHHKIYKALQKIEYSVNQITKFTISNNLPSFLVFIKWLIEGFIGLVVAVILSFLPDHYCPKFYEKLDKNIIVLLDSAVEAISGSVENNENVENSSDDASESKNFFINSVANCLKINPEYNTTIIMKLLFLLIPNSSPK